MHPWHEAYWRAWHGTDSTDRLHPLPPALCRRLRWHLAKARKHFKARHATKPQHRPALRLHPGPYLASLPASWPQLLEHWQAPVLWTEPQPVCTLFSHATPGSAAHPGAHTHTLHQHCPQHLSVTRFLCPQHSKHLIMPRKRTSLLLPAAKPALTLLVACPTRQHVRRCPLVCICPHSSMHLSRALSSRRQGP